MSGFGDQPFGTSPFGTGGPGTGGGGPLVATVEADHVPPRVRLDVTDTTGLQSVTITRLDPDSVYRKVRTSDDQPLPLSGGQATVYDYEAPPGYPLTYSTDQTGTPTATVTVDTDVPWLVHLGVPSRSVTISLRAGSNDEEIWDIDQGVFAVLERSDPIVATAGARLLPSSTLILSVESAGELAAMRLLLSDGSPLLLSVPPSLDVGLSTCYIAVGQVKPQRPANSPGTSSLRDLELPYQQISRPAGGTQAWITWADVATRSGDDYTAAAGSTYATWADVAAAVGSWAELAAPTN